MPLPELIQHLYFKRLGKERPDLVLSIEEKVRLDDQKKARRRATKLARRQSEPANPQPSDLSPPDSFDRGM